MSPDKDSPKGSRSAWMPPAHVVVFGLFILAAIILVVSVFASIRIHRPSTWAAPAMALAWAAMSTVIAGSYAIATGRVASRYQRARKGMTVLEGMQYRKRFKLVGPGVEAEGGEDVVVASKVPAVLLVILSLALAVTLLYLWRSGYTTGYGTFFSFLVPYFMLNWAKQAWPRPEKSDQAT